MSKVVEIESCFDCPHNVQVEQDHEMCQTGECGHPDCEALMTDSNQHEFGFHYPAGAGDVRCRKIPNYPDIPDWCALENK